MQAKPDNFDIRQAGLGLLEAVLATGIFAMVIVGFGRMQVTAKFAKQQAIQMGQVRDVGNYIRQRIDCAQALQNPSCTSEAVTIVEAKACDGSNLLRDQSPFSEVASWRVRAKCGTDIGSNRLLLEYQDKRNAAANAAWLPLDRGIPVTCGDSPMAAATVSKAVAGGEFTCGVIQGRVHCVGTNRNGVLGDNALVPGYHDAPVSSTVIPDPAHTIDSRHMVACFAPIKGLPDAEPDRLFAGPENVCAKYGAELWCWGNNFANRVTGGVSVDGMSGLGPEFRGDAYLNQPTRFGMLATPVKEVVHADHQVACVIMEDGRAQCWGRGGYGGLGSYRGLVITANTIDYGTPCSTWGTSSWQSCRYEDVHAVTPLQYFQSYITPPFASGSGQYFPGFGSNVQKIVSSGTHTCILNGGGVACFGAHASGQLGEPSTVANHGTYYFADPLHFNAPVVALPPPPALSFPVVDIAAGYAHSCAVMRGGAVCWGDNSKRQLGLNSPTTVNSPNLPVLTLGANSGVTAIAAQWNRTCAIVHGSVRCWGELWDGSITATPQVIPNLESGVTSLSMGSGGHACAEKNGQSLCWGANDWGQLGNGGRVYEFGRVEITARSPMCDGSGLGSSGSGTSTGTLVSQCRRH